MGRVGLCRIFGFGMYCRQGGWQGAAIVTGVFQPGG